MAAEFQRLHEYIILGAGTVLLVLAFGLTYATFPPGSGPDRGGLSPAPVFILLCTGVGGAIVGIGLSMRIPIGWKWLRTIFLGVACILGAMTVIISYGQSVDPRFFDASFASVAYRFALGVGAVLLVGVELIPKISATVRTAD